MNVLKHIQDYEKSSYQLIGQSFFLFLVIPVSYLIFLNVMGLNAEIIIQKFQSPNFFNLDFKYVSHVAIRRYSEAISKFMFSDFVINS